MTLIVTTLRPAEIVITSDGRSVERRDGAVVRVVDDLQKVFPVPDHPVAVYHHGVNVLGGMPVGPIVIAFLRQQNVGNLGILELADALRQHVHASVRRRLQQLKDPQVVCGFLVAGFSMRDDRPGVVEITWQQGSETLHMTERRWEPLSLIVSGSGQKQIPKIDLQHVKGSVEEVRKYHAELMQAAIKADVPDNPVGGHVHELLITREKWTWAIPPGDGKAP
jgi:hypothetical protein